MEQRFKIIKDYGLEQGDTERGHWVSREVAVEEIDDRVQYPNQLLLRLKGQLAENFDFKVNDEVVFAYSTRVRTYKINKGTHQEKERGSMECDCWKMEKSPYPQLF